MTATDTATATPTGSARSSNIREQQVLDFFEAWGKDFDTFYASFNLLSDDCEWIQRPIPTVTGAAGAQTFIKRMRSIGLETCDVEILNVSSDGDVVFVERIDRLRRADGSLLGKAPAVGVFTFSGDQVVHWREYFDSAEFTVQAIGTSAWFLVRQLGGLLNRVR